MALPTYLAQGYFSVYGIGSNIGSSNDIVAPSGFLFGAIEAINESTSNNAIGDSVLFKESDVVCKLTWDNAIHQIVPIDKIILTEQVAP